MLFPHLIPTVAVLNYVGNVKDCSHTGVAKRLSFVRQLIISKYQSVEDDSHPPGELSASLFDGRGLIGRLQNEKPTNAEAKQCLTYENSKK